MAENGAVQNSFADQALLQCHFLFHTGLDPKSIVLNYLKNHSLSSFDLKQWFSFVFNLFFFFAQCSECMTFQAGGPSSRKLVACSWELPAVTAHLTPVAVLFACGVVETWDKCGPDMIEEQLSLITT